MNPVFDPDFWKRRYSIWAKEDIRRVLYNDADEAKWLRVEAKHKEILARHIKPGESILDVGCGYGRLLTLLPLQENPWRYTGVDLCDDLITEAKKRHPSYSFVCSDVRELLFQPTYAWGIGCSFRGMVLRELGQEAWDSVHAKLREFCRNLLFLEYDENSEGMVEYESH